MQKIRIDFEGAQSFEIHDMFLSDPLLYGSWIRLGRLKVGFDGYLLSSPFGLIQMNSELAVCTEQVILRNPGRFCILSTSTNQLCFQFHWLPALNHQHICY